MNSNIGNSSTAYVYGTHETFSRSLKFDNLERTAVPRQKTKFT